MLHMLCHGIEVFLKYALMRYGGYNLDAVATFGHNFLRLWQERFTVQLRFALEKEAINVWRAAHTSGLWPNDNFNVDPIEALKNAIPVLSDLHNRREHVLRYILEANGVHHGQCSSFLCFLMLLNAASPIHVF